MRFLRSWKNRNEPDYLRVCSHPRSGTHFVEAFVGKNFYAEDDLSQAEVEWGHWSNRKINPDGNEFQKLFCTHKFAGDCKFRAKRKYLYIMRDGRSVALSIWKTDNFLPNRFKTLSFSDYLREPIDWWGSPSLSTAKKNKPQLPIIQHWDRHLNEWIAASKKHDNILVVSYEQLKNDPYSVYKTIRNHFFSEQPALQKEQVDVVAKPTGLLPNNSDNQTSKEFFSDEDNQFYFSQMSEGNPYLSQS